MLLGVLAVTCGDTPTEIWTVSGGSHQVLIANTSASDILWIGDTDDFTTSTGFPIQPNSHVTLLTEQAGTIYGLRGGVVDISARALPLGL